MEVYIGIALFVGFGFVAGGYFERRKWQKASGSKSPSDVAQKVK